MAEDYQRPILVVLYVAHWGGGGGWVVDMDISLIYFDIMFNVYFMVIVVGVVCLLLLLFVCCVFLWCFVVVVVVVVVFVIIRR